MPTKADSRPQDRRLLANLTRLARIVEQIEQTGSRDARAWRRLRRVVPDLADCLTAILEAKEGP